MRRAAILFGLTLFLVLGACLLATFGQTHQGHYGLSGETRRILNTADDFTLFALHPGRPLSGAELFHDYSVVGQFKLRRGKERNRLLSALYDGVAASDGKMRACFNPRHGIRATLGGQTVDVVICFECLLTEVHKGDQVETFPTTDSPRKIFNESLTKAGLPPGT
jgi:hypothetical protein